MVVIDGRAGEGGGQMLRTSLALAAITGQAVRLHHIRAKRRNPGLAPQHLAAVWALAEVCQADVHGAKLRATEIEFHPQTTPQPGSYRYNVAHYAQGGSAGSVTLLAQALLLPLALASSSSTLTLQGGTHVAWSPPFDYLEQVYLPALAQIGLQASARLDRWGFYPAGGGELHMEIEGKAAFRPIRLDERGPLQRVHGRAVASNLPAAIPNKIAGRATNVLRKAEVTASIQPLRVRSNGPGVGIFIVAEYEHARTGAVAFGRKGKPSAEVAEEAVEMLLDYHQASAPVDPFLADQLLLPAALADGPSRYQITRVTQHLLTNAEVVGYFVGAQITIRGEMGEPGVVEVVPG